MAIAVGDRAPDFRLLDQHGSPFELAELRGRKALMLVFFPFAFSGICTGELTGFRDRLGDFEDDRVTLAAVSCDSVFTQRALADRDGIFFPLLADFWPHGAVARSYGVFDETDGNAGRASFLIDRDGVVRWTVHNPRAERRDLDEHAEAVRRFL